MPKRNNNESVKEFIRVLSFKVKKKTTYKLT